jgi:hypothetical protein
MASLFFQQEMLYSGNIDIVEPDNLDGCVQVD